MVPEDIAECMRASSSDGQISKPLELKQTGWGIELEKWWRHKGMGLIETLGIQGQIVPASLPQRMVICTALRRCSPHHET